MMTEAGKKACVQFFTYDINEERSDVTQETGQGEDGGDKDDNSSHNAHHMKGLQVFVVANACFFLGSNQEVGDCRSYLTSCE